MAIIKNPGLSIIPINEVNSTSNRPVSSSAVYNYLSGGIPYITTAPTADNPNANERIILVVLPESQRASTIQYEGYWYVFVQVPQTP